MMRFDQRYFTVSRNSRLRNKHGDGGDDEIRDEATGREIFLIEGLEKIGGRYGIIRCRIYVGVYVYSTW